MRDFTRLANRVRALLGAGVSAALPIAPAQAGAPPCAAPEYGQFDFWLGEWEVTADGRVAGRNSIVKQLGNCVVQESWKGASGTEGRSLNVYDSSRGRWHQTWVDSSGGLLLLEGGLRNGAMVLEGTQRDDETRAVTRERITWTPAPDGSVRQLWEYSTDDGKSWKARFDGQYRRVRAATR